jgi:hypothetical protein
MSVEVNKEDRLNVAATHRTLIAPSSPLLQAVSVELMATAGLAREVVLKRISADCTEIFLVQIVLVPMLVLRANVLVVVVRVRACRACHTMLRRAGCCCGARTKLMMAGCCCARTKLVMAGKRANVRILTMLQRACTMLLRRRPGRSRTKLCVCYQLLPRERMIAKLRLGQWVQASKDCIILATMLHEAVLVPAWLLRCGAKHKRPKRVVGVVRLVRRMLRGVCLIW